METEVNTVPRDENQPVIRKSKANWMLVSDSMVLISSASSDKEYMERYLKNWRKNNV